MYSSFIATLLNLQIIFRISQYQKQRNENLKVRRAERGDVTDGSQESMTSAQSCDNCTLSDGGKPEATTTMPRLLLVQHHTPPAKRMNIPVIEHNDNQNQKEQVALFQEERRERCGSSRRRDDVSAASPLPPKWTRQHQLLLRHLVLLLLLCFVLRIVSQHFLMDRIVLAFVTDNFHFKKRVDLYMEPPGYMSLRASLSCSSSVSVSSHSS